MAKKQSKNNKAVFELLVAPAQLNDLEKYFSVYASPNVEDLVVANEEEPKPLDGDVIEVAVYHFVGFEKYKKSQYTRVED